MGISGLKSSIQVTSPHFTPPLRGRWGNALFRETAVAGIVLSVGFVYLKESQVPFFREVGFPSFPQGVFRGRLARRSLIRWLVAAFSLSFSRRSKI